MILDIQHVQLTVPKGAEAEARRFYCGVLGLPEVQKPASLTGRGGLWLRVGDRQVHIGVEDGVDRQASKAHIAYEVSSLEEWKRKLATLGIEVIDGIPLPGHDRIEFRDPFGNRVEFIQRRRTMAQSERLVGHKPPLTFGTRREGVAYTDRPAAYAVVAGENGTVAAVWGASGRAFLPGGGSLPGESPEETLVREVREELARSVRLVRPLGEAMQFFYSADEDCHYRMAAVFFLAEFPEERSGQGEHDLFWLPLGEADQAFFHPSHAWACRQGLEKSTPGPRAPSS
jgi:catechol 2,3-dioxygenase-like lactoylglutathione lyase family enzyme/ADP-ribose pyrophosphatase YjhB (NUDIX family)